MELSTMRMDVDAGVAHVQLTRGAALNTMNAAFWTEIVEVFAEIDRRGDVRCAVLSSTGKHFTAGLDLAWAASDLPDPAGDVARHREHLRRKVKRMQESFSAIDRARVPVIAVIQGGCIGGGVDLVTACDLRVGTADCFFTIQEVNIGIVADVGTLQRLPHILGQGLVRELAYTGRRFHAEEARAAGLLNRVAATHEAAVAEGLALAREIASKSPMAIIGTKAVLNYGRDHSVEDGLEYVAVWNAAMLPGDDMTRAVRAQMAKEVPVFEDLKAG